MLISINGIALMIKEPMPINFVVPKDLLFGLKDTLIILVPLKHFGNFEVHPWTVDSIEFLMNLLEKICLILFELFDPFLRDYKELLVGHWHVLIDLLEELMSVQDHHMTLLSSLDMKVSSLVVD